LPEAAVAVADFAADSAPTHFAAAGVGTDDSAKKIAVGLPIPPAPVAAPVGVEVATDNFGHDPARMVYSYCSGEVSDSPEYYRWLLAAYSAMPEAALSRMLVVWE
jgi:hypothetical protein